MPTSILWGARVSEVGVAAERRLTALWPDLLSMQIDTTEACSQLKRRAAARIVIRPEIRGLSKCADPAAH
jgi:hypothetical protein